MVNICGKCEHYTRSETDNNGNFYHYCAKADELYGNEPKPDSAEPSVNETPTLKVKFNSEICEYYEKKRRH